MDSVCLAKTDPPNFANFANFTELAVHNHNSVEKGRNQGCLSPITTICQDRYASNCYETKLIHMLLISSFCEPFLHAGKSFTRHYIVKVSPTRCAGDNLVVFTVNVEGLAVWTLMTSSTFNDNGHFDGYSVFQTPRPQRWYDPLALFAMN